MNHWNKSKDISEQELKGRGISRPNKWEVIYETISRWSLNHIARINEKAEEVTKKIPDKLKKEITDAARAVDKSTHEEVNASSQAEFLLKVATGEYRNKDGKKFETTAKMKDGTSSPLTNIAEKQYMAAISLLQPHLSFLTFYGKNLNYFPASIKLSKSKPYFRVTICLN